MSAESPKWEDDVQANVYSLTSDVQIRDYSEISNDNKSGMYEVEWPTKISPSELLRALSTFLKEAQTENNECDVDEKNFYTIELTGEGIVDPTDPESLNEISEIYVETEFGDFNYYIDEENDRWAKFISTGQLAYPLTRLITSTTSDLGVNPERLRETLRTVGRKKNQDPFNRIVKLTEDTTIPPQDGENEAISLN